LLTKPNFYFITRKH